MEKEKQQYKSRMEKSSDWLNHRAITNAEVQKIGLKKSGYWRGSREGGE